MADQFLNAKGVYDLLGGAIPLGTLYFYFKTGQLPAKKIGSHWIIDREKLLAVLRSDKDDEPFMTPPAPRKTKKPRGAPKVKLW